MAKTKRAKNPEIYKDFTEEEMELLRQSWRESAKKYRNPRKVNEGIIRRQREKNAEKDNNRGENG